MLVWLSQELEKPVAVLPQLRGINTKHQRTVVTSLAADWHSSDGPRASSNNTIERLSALGALSSCPQDLKKSSEEWAQTARVTVAATHAFRLLTSVTRSVSEHAYPAGTRRRARACIKAYK